MGEDDSKWLPAHTVPSQEISAEEIDDDDEPYGDQTVPHVAPHRSPHTDPADLARAADFDSVQLDSALEPQQTIVDGDDDDDELSAKTSRSHQDATLDVPPDELEAWTRGDAPQPRGDARQPPEDGVLFDDDEGGNADELTHDSLEQQDYEVGNGELTVPVADSCSDAAPRQAVEATKSIDTNLQVTADSLTRRIDDAVYDDLDDGDYAPMDGEETEHGRSSDDTQVSARGVLHDDLQLEGDLLIESASDRDDTHPGYGDDTYTDLDDDAGLYDHTGLNDHTEQTLSETQLSVSQSQSALLFDSDVQLDPVDGRVQQMARATAPQQPPLQAPPSIIEITDSAAIVEITNSAAIVEITDSAAIVEITDSAAIVELTDPAILQAGQAGNQTLGEVTDPAILQAGQARDQLAVVDITDPGAVIEIGTGDIDHSETGRAHYLGPQHGAQMARPTEDDLALPQKHPERPELQWENRIVELEQLLAHQHGYQRIGALLELAQLCDEQLQDRAEAIGYLERARELDPENGVIFEHLARLYRLEWETDKLIELLLMEQELETAPARRLELLVQLADLFSGQEESDREQAVLEAALAIEPDNADVNERLTLFKSPAQVEQSPKDPESMLLDELERATADEDRIEILEQLTTLAIQNDRIESAIGHLEAILHIAPRREHAHRKLQQIYRKLGDAEALKKALADHAAVVAPGTRIELYRQLAELCENVGDLQGAVNTFYQLAQLAPNDYPTLRALIRLHEQLQNSDALLEVLQQASYQLPRQSPERVPLLHRQALLLREVGNEEAAEACLQQLLEIDPSHGETIGALYTMYSQRGDWGKAVRMLLAAEAHTASPMHKARLLHDAATARLHHLDDTDGAAALLERALEIDPDNVQARITYAEILYQRRQYERLSPLLEALLRQLPAGERPDLTLRLAEASEALENHSRAHFYYQQVLAVDADNLRALRGLGTMAFKLQDYHATHQTYHRLLALKPPLSTDELEQVLFELGVSSGRLGAHSQAEQHLRDLLDLRPGHKEALKRLASVEAKSDDWAAVLRTKRSLLEGATDETDMVRLSLEIGDLQRERLQDMAGAERSYRAALELRPKDHKLLHRLLDLYSAIGRWTDTVDICTRLAENEQSSVVKAKYLRTAAQICQGELSDYDQAIRLFNRALDANPEELKAFQAIDAMCTERRDWRGLEQSYGRMLKRLSDDDATRPLKTMLWHNLGEVMRTRRRDFEGAIAAFEAALRLEPENLERRQILIELYMSCGTEYRDRAIKMLHEMIEREPRRATPYRMLRKLYISSGKYDPAWCIAAALTFMQQANQEERELHDRYRARRPPPINVRITDDVWRLLYHQDQDPYLGALFALVAPAIGPSTARPPSHFGLKKKEHCDPSKEKNAFCSVFLHALAAMALPAPKLFLKPDKHSGLQLAHTSDHTSFVAGANAMGRKDPREMAFLSAKQLAHLHPSLFLRVALQTRAQLDLVFLAALKLTQPETAIPKEKNSAVNKNVDLLKRKLQLPQIEQLGSVVRKVSDGKNVDLEKWWNAVELTTDRVGLLFAGDLEAATRVISSEPSATAMTPKQRASELVRFHTSSALMQLRKRVGTSIDR
jgi:tetratricopeptide (TPR) repeat protein